MVGNPGMHCWFDNKNDCLGLYSNNLQQFGFKQGVGCTHAIYALYQTVNYYNAGGSDVHLCSIDLAKAFDKVDHSILFQKLLNRRCPAKFVRNHARFFSCLV